MARWPISLQGCEPGFTLTIRTPAYDRRIFEFCIGIPEDQYLRNGRDRWLIRRAMDGRLPNVVLNQKKVGAQAADWFPKLTRVTKSPHGGGEAPS